MRISVEVFYKKIHIRNIKNLPQNQPVVLACNHPNSFLDPIIVSVFVKNRLHYLARSDAFNTPFKKWILGKIGLVPIYRLQEGADKLHKNEETFDICAEILAKNGTIIIFSEGLCIQERRLRKLKKGTARLVFGAEAARDFNMDLLIVPIGMNYYKPENFRSDLVINFGKPIKLKAYEELYKEDKARAINALTGDLEKQMAAELLIIEEQKNDFLVADLEEIYGKEILSKNNFSESKSEKKFLLSCGIAEAINRLQKNNFSKAEIFRKKIVAYSEELEKNNLRDYFFWKNPITYAQKNNFSIQVFELVIGFPLFVYGLIVHYVPYKISYSLTNKIVKNIEFFSSVNCSAGTFIFLIFYIMESLLLIHFFNFFVLIGFILLLPLSGKYALRYQRLIKKVKGKISLRRLIKKDKSFVEHLFSEREEILQEWKEIKFFV
ncbi:MAG: lysophospholipid acyltransferase family protein [Bacteroidia bacterium]